MEHNIDNYFREMFLTCDPTIKLDEEQKKAIMCDDTNVMIIAGAGSGKTTTMAAKVKYLVEVKGVDPNQIVMISYTNKAVEELQKRINGDFDLPVPIYTFHKLGMTILKNAGIEKQVLENSFIFLQNIIYQKIKEDSHWRLEVLSYLSYYHYFSPILVKIQNNQLYKKIRVRIEYLSLLGQVSKINQGRIYKLEKEQLNINGEYMNRVEEVMIANFLFLHGIEYRYKIIYLFERNYIADFKLVSDAGVEYYLELIYHESKNYSEYRKELNTIHRIRKIHEKYGTKLIELEMVGNFLGKLKTLLREKGFVFKKKSEKEIFELLKNLQKSLMYKEFQNLCYSFLHCFKLSGYDQNQFNLWKKVSLDVRSITFLNLVEPIYILYKERLAEEGYYDFEDMINDAMKILQTQKLILNYKYVIVDEYQDISRERFLFLKQLIDVTKAKLIVVGDDWQSIFSFAGSDISLFMDFDKYIGVCKRLKITHTYRNSQELIDIAGGFVMKNQSQIKKDLISFKRLDPSVLIYLYLDKKEKAKCLDKCIRTIVENYGEQIEILLLGRYKFDLYSILNKKYFQKMTEEIISINFPQVKLHFMTIHAAKGLGFPHVIIINGEGGEYGFPSEKIMDPIMELVVNRREDYEYAEERRLFYVALTRTKNTVSILCPVYNTSVFVQELKNVKVINLSGKKWKNKTQICPYCHSKLVRNYWNQKGIEPLYQCINDRKICGFETNNLDYKIRIKSCKSCENGYLIVVESNKHCYLQCTNYGKNCNYRIKI